MEAYKGAADSDGKSVAAKGIKKIKKEMVYRHARGAVADPVEYIWSEKGKPLMRIGLSYYQVTNMFGGALMSKEARGEVAIKDSSGKNYPAVAYVLSWLNGTDHILVRGGGSDTGIQAQDMRLSRMVNGDGVFLYFEVHPGSLKKITELRFTPVKGEPMAVELRYPK